MRAADRQRGADAVAEASSSAITTTFHERAERGDPGREKVGKHMRQVDLAQQLHARRQAEDAGHVAQLVIERARALQRADETSPESRR
jgi:hypothetical protein